MKTLWIALSALVLLGAGYGTLTVLNEAHRKQADLEAKVEDVEGHLQSTEKAAADAKAALAQAQSDLAQSQSALAVAASLAAQKDRLAEQKKEADRVAAEKQAGAEANQTMAVQTLATTVGDYQSQLAALQKKNDALAAQFARLQAMYDQLAGQNSRLNTQISQMQSEMAAARDQAVKEATALLRQQLADAQQALAALPSSRPSVADLQYVVAKKIHTPSGQLRSGTVTQTVVASWSVVLQGLQSGTTYPPIVVSEGVFNSLGEGQTYSRGNLHGIAP